eukprot:7004048-Pyramimonas_sp.AAC.1
MGSAVDREFLDRFPAGAMFNDGVRTCVQIRIRLGAASDNEASALAHDAVQYHTRLQSRVASHTRGNADNIGRSTRLAASLLSTDPAQAKEAA